MAIQQLSLTRLNVVAEFVQERATPIHTWIGGRKWFAQASLLFVGRLVFRVFFVGLGLSGMLKRFGDCTLDAIEGILGNLLGHMKIVETIVNLDD